MVKIIVAFATADKCTHFAGALEEAGYPVFRRCTSGSEVRRALNQYDDSIVVCPCRLSDCTADELAWDMGKKALMLVVGRPEQLENCEHPDVFRLKLPCSRGEISSAVSMLVQLHQMRLPRRTEDEKQVVDRAKQYLMEKYSMTEPEAHRHLQKGAMDKGMKLVDYAMMLMQYS